MRVLLPALYAETLRGRSISGPPRVCLGLKGRGDGLYLGVVVKHFLAHLAAPAGLFVSAERQGGVEDVVAIDPDGAGADAPRHLVRRAEILCPHTGSESIDGVVGFARDAIQVGVGE